MSSAIPADVLARYFQVLEDGCHGTDDWEFLEASLDHHAELVRTRLPSGELPLRMLLRCHRWAPGLFLLLANQGAEHDLITASAAADVAAVERLLHDAPQRVHEADEEGGTALHWACGQMRFAQQPCDTVGLVNLLMAAGSDLEARDEHGLTPLHRSVLDGNGEACEPLLEHGAVPNVLYGIVTEDYGLLDNLLDADPRQVHWRDPRDDRSVLHVAIQWECERAMFEYLLARGATAEIDSRFGRAAQTPLLLAIANSQSEAAEALVLAGADVNAREQRVDSVLRDSSALKLAVSHDHVGLTESLIARGADSRQRIGHGRNLLWLVESEEMVELLIRSGTSLQERDDGGQDVLSHAVEEGRQNIVRALIRHGAVPTFYASVVLGDCARVTQMLESHPELARSFAELCRGPVDVPRGDDANGTNLLLTKNGSSVT